MVDIKNVAKEYLGSKVHIMVPKSSEYKEDWEFDIELLEEDKLSILENIQKLELTKNKDSDLNIKDLLKEQEDIIFKILRKSYTENEFKDEEIRNITTKRSQEIMLELTFILGIRDRDSFNKLKEAQIKALDNQLKNLMGETQAPKKSEEKATQN